MVGLNSGLAPCGEEPLQTFMFEARNHRLSVTYMVTGYKRLNAEGSRRWQATGQSAWFDKK